MPTIQTKSVKYFKSKASKIPTNKILPICGFIKFDFDGEKCYITKNNTKAFICESFSATGKGKFLIDEKVLFNFVDFCKDEFFTIELSEEVVLLSSLTSTSFESPTDKPELFPTNELPDSDGEILNPDVIDELKTAVNFIIEEENPTPRSFVFIGNGVIAASNGHIAYFVKTSFPGEMILRKEVIDALPDNGVKFYQNKSYDFFEGGTAIIGFIKSDFKFFDLASLMAISGKKDFEIKKQDLIEFNESALGSATSKSIVATWEFNGSMRLKADDPMFNVKAKLNLKVTGSGKFTYNPASLNKLLKSVPGETLQFFEAESKYFITDADQTFVSLIMGIV